MVETSQFGDLITFSAGANITRLSNEVTENNIYTLEDFDNDLITIRGHKEDISASADKDKSVILHTGDIVISVTRNKAVMVSSDNSGKYLNSNFIKCEFDKQKLYPWYFCYLLNESSSVSQQIKKMQQGTIGCINRLTLNMIASLQFILEDISKQKVIGDLYRNLLIEENLMKKKMENIKRYTFEVIKRVDKN